MAFTKTWDESTPAAGEDISTGDDKIRELKYAVRERLAVDHEADATEAGNDFIGDHKKATFHVQAAAPTAVANTGILYTKDVTAVAELHFIDESSNEIQITTGGKIKKESIHNNAYVPVGCVCLMETGSTVPTGWTELLSPVAPTGFIYIKKS